MQSDQFLPDALGKVRDSKDPIIRDGKPGLILISGLRFIILSMKFLFYTCSHDHLFVSEVVIWVNICLK